MRNTLRAGFTLVEILIVVVILGILAAIVIPQFTGATQDAQAGNLKAQLVSVQSQIELYRARNQSNHPFSTADWSRMVPPVEDYLKSIPVNPASAYADKTTISTGTSGTGSATTSWFYRTDTNMLYASFFDESTGLVTLTGTD